MNKRLKSKCYLQLHALILSFCFIALMVIMVFDSIYPASFSFVYAQGLEKNNKAKGQSKNITLDFDNVDIRLVIKFMSDLMGKNFLIDDGVKGNVTIISPTSIPIDEAYKVFESILEVKGFAAVPSGSIIKIVPIRDAASRNIEMRTQSPKPSAGIDDTLVTQLIPIEHANVDAIKGVIAPLVSKESKLITYPATNTIILTETASNIERLLKIIKEIDVPGEDIMMKIISLKYAAPDAIAKQVLLAMEDQKARVRVTGARKTRVVAKDQGIKTKIIPDTRTGILIIIAEEEKMTECLDLIEELDIPTPRGKDNIRVHPLKNSSAEDMSKVLSNILNQQKVQAQKGGSELGAIIQDSIITADKATNSLIITASPQDYEIISRIINELDIMRPQVLVEALIAEVSFDKTVDVGVEWRVMDGLDKPADDSIKGFGGTNFGQIEGVQTGTIPTGMSIGVTKGFITIGNVKFPNIGALITAYQADNDINILSTPHILATDNEEAKIIVGDEVPYQHSEIIDNTTRYSYNYKDVGLTLQFTPHINPDGYVKLDITIKIDTVIRGTPTEAPWTNKREAITTVMVKDRQTVVIGGLLQDDRFKSFNRVPCLGDIPFFGWAFRYMSKSNDKKNLQVFLTPHIINTPEDLLRLTASKEASLNLEKTDAEPPVGKKDVQKEDEREGTESEPRLPETGIKVKGDPE